LQRYEPATADFSAAIRLQPKEAFLYLERAVTLAAMGRHAEALADRSEAVRLQPGLAEAYVARGSSYHALGRHKEGMRTATRPSG